MNKERLEAVGKICIPGMRLTLCNSEYISGPGTYELMGYIYSSLAGVLRMEKDEQTKVNSRQ